jgi:hypothetical protein
LRKIDFLAHPIIGNFLKIIGKAKAIIGKSPRIIGI